jgi:(p)ppGpp synthase/HD superfamily hydrolase
MPLTSADLPSRKAIDRAGTTLRDWWLRNDPNAPIDEEALFTVATYRATFRRPLKTVTVGVRQFVQRESARVTVSERLKRLPTIVDKLARLPNMKVTRMEDIGGCRAILEDVDEVQRVLARIRKNKWPERRFRDYIQEPKETGYRAIHLVVERQEGRPVEIQLRTRNQHAWAAQVERVGARIGTPLKDGVGPAELVRFFQLAGWVLAIQDGTERADDALYEEFRGLYPGIRERYPDL